MKSMEQQIRNALAALEKEPGRAWGNAGCPGEETLVLFAEGVLAPDERTSVCRHLNTCTRCREIFALDASAAYPGEEEKTAAEVDPVLLRRAKDLLDPVTRVDVFDLVLSRVRDGLKVVHSGMKLLSPQGNRLTVAAVRTVSSEPVPSDSVRAEKPLDRYAAEVEVAPSNGDSWDSRE